MKSLPVNQDDEPNRPLPWQVKVALALILVLMFFMIFGCAAVPAPAKPPIPLASLMPPQPSMAVSRSSATLLATVPRWLQPVTNSVELQWKPSPSDNVVGYNFYVGGLSGCYTNYFVLGNESAFVFYFTRARTNYPTYYFAVTAVDVDGIESDFSNEATWSVVRPPPPPVLTGFTLTGHSLIQQSTDLVNWSMPILLDGSLTLSLAPGNLFFRGTNLTLTPNYQLDTP